jgi:ankyrin repeat protein
VLLRRAAKKDNLPLLKRTLRAAIGYFEEKEKDGEAGRMKGVVQPAAGAAPLTPPAAPPAAGCTASSTTTTTNTAACSGLLLNIGNVNNKTALHFAAQNAGPNMLRFLLRHGADANAHCTRGQTPICFAIAKRRYRNAEVLLEAGASLLVRTVLGETPLDLAIAHVALPRRDLVLRMQEAFRREIEANMESSSTADSIWHDFTGNEAAILNQLDHARSCENCQANARALGRGGQISITSVGSGKRRTRRHFDFDFDDASDDDGSTGHIDDSKTPDLTATAGLNSLLALQRTNEAQQQTATALQPDQGRSRRVQKSRCAAMEYTQRHGKVRKAAANSNGDASDLRDLLQHGRDKWGRGHSNYALLVESPSPGSGRTALMMAAWRGHVHNVALLLDEGASIDRYTKRSGNYGKTPIFYASTRCRDDVVLLLLSRGANVLIVNNKGQTPRSLAVSHLSKETTEQVARVESEQLAAGGIWRDFRESRVNPASIGPDLTRVQYARAVISEIRRVIMK